MCVDGAAYMDTVFTEEGMRPAIVVEGVSSSAPLRVLYIAGCGRSGSTFLDTILGNHPEMESVGEACHIAKNAWLSENTYCACGEIGRNCSFWKEVHRQWERRVGPVDLAEYVRLAQEIEPRLRISLTQRRLAARDSRHVEYVRLAVGLLAAIRDVSGVEIIVDSSKAASRALALSMVEGVDLRLVHMVRDCRGVLWSGKKRFRKDDRAGISKDDRGKSISHTMKIWAVANMVTEQLRRHLPRGKSIRLRYEDMISYPHGELRRIGDLVEKNLESLAEAVAGGESMAVGHTIAGNRVRMAGSMPLRPDVEWIEKLTWREQAACWSLVGWLMKVYGYPWQVNRLGDSVQRSAA